MNCRTCSAIRALPGFAPHFSSPAWLCGLLLLAGSLWASGSAGAATPITSVPWTISQPGVYIFTQNLACTTCTFSDAITITASDVTLDGGHYQLSGNGSGTGIHVMGGSRVTITRTGITGFSTGIFLENATDNSVADNNVSNNNEHGVDVEGGSGTTLTGNTANFGQYGIAVGGASRTTLTANTASNNSFIGMIVGGSAGGAVTDNQVNANASDGIALAGARDILVSQNTTNGNGMVFGEAGIHVYQSSVHNILIDNTARGNFGFDLEDDTTGAPCQDHWEHNDFVTDNDPACIK